MMLDRIQILAPMNAELISVQYSRPFKPFASEIIAFLENLSEILIANPSAKKFPDLYSFGFWCRRASLESMRRSYLDIEHRIGRGVVFHIAPSNVPLNFAYSLVAALLAGNANIVRVPSDNFVQVDIIAQAIDMILNKSEHIILRDHIRLVRYARDAQDITEMFSFGCDVRVIWGGDATINRIRQNALKAHAFDVTFSDRYSFCLIGAAKYLSEGNHKEVAKGFYNDTYLFDQNACTAPHLVLWWGEADDVKRSQEIFWDELHVYAKNRYDLKAQSAITKWTNALRYAGLHRGCRIRMGNDNIITRIEVEKIDSDIDQWSSSCGFFFEYKLKDLEHILTLVSRRYQTLSYAGLDKDMLRNLVIQGRALGVDRVVPIGRTLEFSLQWDGFDLIRTLSRVVMAN